jgi:hypothetical protein
MKVLNNIRVWVIRGRVVVVEFRGFKVYYDIPYTFFPA